MKPLLLSSLVAAVVPILTPCAAMSDDVPLRTNQDVELVFQSLDRDHDRQISKAEANRKQSVRKRFDGIDSNGDGYLSKAEFAARPSNAPFE